MYSPQSTPFSKKNNTIRIYDCQSAVSNSAGLYCRLYVEFEYFFENLTRIEAFKNKLNWGEAARRNNLSISEP